MANAQIIQIADAVVTSLNEANLSQDFTSVRQYIPHFILEDLQSIQISVVPGAQASEQITRSEVWRETYDIDVAVQKSADPTSTSDIDPLMQLADEIKDHIKQAGTMASYSLVGPISTTDPAFVEDHQKSLHVFTSVSTFSYRKAR